MQPTTNPLNSGESLGSETREGPDNWYDADGRLRGSAEPIPGRCGRKLPKTDPPRYCKKYPLKGRTACRKCGGSTPAGPAHYAYKPINHLPMDLTSTKRGEKIAAILDSPNLLSLTPQYAYLMSRINDLLADERTGRHDSLWEDLQEQIATLRERLADPDRPTPPTDADLAAIGELATNGRANSRIDRDVRALIQECAKVASIEARRQADAGEVATKEEMAAFATVISSGIKEFFGPLSGGQDAIIKFARYVQQHVKRQNRPAPTQEPAPQPIEAESRTITDQQTQDHRQRAD